MVRPGITRLALSVFLVTLSLAGTRASAGTLGGGGSTGPVTFTGNVETDMPLGTIPGSQIIDGGPATRVAQASWITSQGWTTGWAMKDVRFNYDVKTDTMQVGINFYSIAGDADGNGNPGVADPRMLAAGGVDTAPLAGQKSITMAFAPDSSTSPSQPGSAVAIAGVPANKSQAGSGLDGFTVASYVNGSGGIQYNYGAPLTTATGTLAFDPSAAHPDFEFTINNFSKIPGLNPSKGFWFQAYAGSPADVIAGEETVGWSRVGGQFAPQTIPEPATLLAWGAVAGLAAVRLRRSRRKPTVGI